LLIDSAPLGIDAEEVCVCGNVDAAGATVFGATFPHAVVHRLLVQWVGFSTGGTATVNIDRKLRLCADGFSRFWRSCEVPRLFG
jgi:hypothetical protein